MALACVEPLNQADLPRAQELAARWGVPLLKDLAVKTGVKVVVSDVALGLGFVDAKRGKPYYVDFLTRSWRTRFAMGLGKRHILTRALGYKDAPLKVYDLTAGFGQDAVQALLLGCDVTAVERSPVVVSVLRDGVMRAMREEESTRDKWDRFKIIEIEASRFLTEALGRNELADVIYLDPMFDKPKKTAKSPKEMQLLQELLEPDTPTEMEELFHQAMSCARNRVVVKRPLKGQALWLAPSHSFKGQSIRYDVYLSASAKRP